MTVRANWFLDTQEVDVTEVGAPIDLTDPPQLNRRLIRLLEQESALDSQGVTCPVKAREDTTCSACSIRHTDTADRMTMLCDVGCEQEGVLTQLAIHHAQPDGPPG